MNIFTVKTVGSSKMVKINIELLYLNQWFTERVLDISFAYKLKLFAQKNVLPFLHTYDLGLMLYQNDSFHIHRLIFQFSAHLNNEYSDCCIQFHAGNVYVVKGMLSLEI